MKEKNRILIKKRIKQIKRDVVKGDKMQVKTENYNFDYCYDTDVL